MGIFRAGLLSRRRTNTGMLLLCAVAIAAASAAPMYARSTAEHLLDQRTLEHPTTDVGLTVELYPYNQIPSTVIQTNKDVLTEKGRAQMLAKVSDLMDTDEANAFWQPTIEYLRSTGAFHFGGRAYQIDTYWRDGMCRHLTLVGTCPTGQDEALIDATMLKALDLRIGDTVDVDFTAYTTAETPASELTRTYTLVGTYSIAHPADAYWFDPSRTSGSLRPPAPGSTATPKASALLVDPSAITLAPASKAGGDRAIDVTKFNIATTQDARTALRIWRYRTENNGPPVLPSDTRISVRSLVSNVDAEQALLSRITIVAVTPLVVLALLLLYLLVSLATQQRQAEIALAKLRGHRVRRVLTFAINEPVSVLALAIPIGVAAGTGGERAIAAAWLGTVPLVVPALSWWAVSVVAASSLIAVTAAAVKVVREPIASSLQPSAAPVTTTGTTGTTGTRTKPAGASRSRTGARLGVLGQGAAAAAAVSAVVQLRSTEETTSSSYLELLTPMLLALAVAALAPALVRLLARGWVRLTARRGGVPSLLAATRIQRGHQLVPFVMPILLATAMASFSAASWRTSDDWRSSRAAAKVGAATSYYTSTNPSRLLWVTQQADPTGRYLAAAINAAPRTSDGARVALVDATRYANVTAWDHSWGATPTTVQQWLQGTRQADPVIFSGSTITVDLADVNLTGSLNMPPEFWIRYVPTSSGEQRLVRIGTLQLEGSYSLQAPIPDCVAGCSLQQLFIAGSSSSVTDAEGMLTIADISTNDSNEPDWRLTDPDAWRPARPFGVSGAAPAEVESTRQGLRVTLTGREAAIVRITTTDIDAEPWLVLTTSSDATTRDGVTEGASLLGTRTPMRLAGHATDLPLVGNDGGISDLNSALREYGDQSLEVVQTELLVAPATPASVLSQVSDYDVTLDNRLTEADVLTTMRGDAFSQGWRLFLLCGALMLVLALSGTAAISGMQAKSRAYEAACLRVAGVRKATIRRAILYEYAALLALGTCAGLAISVVALRLVLPRLYLGDADSWEPLADYSLSAAPLLAVLALTAVPSGGVVIWQAARIIKTGSLSLAPRHGE